MINGGARFYSLTQNIAWKKASGNCCESKWKGEIQISFLGKDR